MKRGTPASLPSIPRITLNVLCNGSNDSLIAEVWLQNKICRVSIDAGVPVTTARPEIVAGQPERKPSRLYVLQMASGEIIPILKEALVELTLGRGALKILVFVAEITDEFILGLDILRACDASVDLGRRILRLDQEEVSLWRPRSSRLTLASDEMIPARLREVTARSEGPLEAANGRGLRR
jgi:hypothetical protein